MKNDDMRQELVHLGNGAHALATQMLGSPDDAADAEMYQFLSHIIVFHWIYSIYALLLTLFPFAAKKIPMLRTHILIR